MMSATGVRNLVRSSAPGAAGRIFCRMTLPVRRRFSLALLSLLATTGSCGEEMTAPPESFIGRFDLFWSTFDRQYSYFVYKRVNWDSLRSVYRPRAEAATTQTELVAVLREMVAPLRDIHVRFNTPTGGTLATHVPAHSPNWQRHIWLNAIRSCVFGQPKPNLGWCRMGAFPYIIVERWDESSFSASDLDALIDRFPQAPGMIIDVRPNAGGDDGLAFAFAGRFATRRTTAGYVRFREGARHDDFGREIARYVTPRGAFRFTQPVIVLSGRASFSANESFVAAMRELPNVTVLGDTTGGGSGNPGTYPLGDGWSYSVSRWIEWTADRRVVEWNGIPPDVFVRWDDDALKQGRDPVLEAALARLSGAAPRVR